MALETVKDFDFGVGPNISVTHRVSGSPSDVTKMEVDFIMWLMLEQEFRKSKRKQQVQQQHIGRRTQTDGNLPDEDDDEDDGDEIDRPMISNDPTNEIARKYAEQTLQDEGLNVLWQDLADEYRENLLLQLCKNCEFLQGPVQSVQDIFVRLKSSKFRSKFSVKKHLAKGGFGEVFLVTKEDDSTNEQYAIKKITPCDSNLDDIKAAINESKILKILKGHKNIVEIYDYWLEIEPVADDAFISRNNFDEDLEEGPLKFYIQLEFCTPSLEAWKDSNHKRGIVPEKVQNLSIAMQIFEGLAYINKKGILHLDINPKNILWKDLSCTQLKIVDFGLARIAPSHNTKDGTVGYIAPESPLTHKSDVYSATVTIIEVAKSIYTKNELAETIQRKAVDTGIPCLNGLLSLALEVDPSKRPSAAEIEETLSVQQ